MANVLSSRERMLAALACREPDRVPCCFSAFMALGKKCRSREEYVTRQQEMGLDVVVEFGELPVRHEPVVTNRQWREDPPGGPYPLLHSEYDTPAGKLLRTVSKSEDWEHGDTVPFLSDFIIARGVKHLITPDDSLEALRYLLAPPTDEEAQAYAKRAAAARALADERKLATMAGVAMHGDFACWLSGIQGLMLMCMDQPEFVREYFAIVEDWNRKRMAVVLAEKPDVFIRRGWYESADFWSPALYREFQLPALRRDAEQVHAAGSKLGYIVSCSSMPLLDLFMEAGVDVLLGIDPAQDRMLDMPLMKRKTQGRMALWGGVCGYLTVECGTPEDIRSEVREAVKVLAPGGGFILAPVTNVRADTEQAWRNVEAMIAEWKRLCVDPAT
jgi:hypothetical protein